MPFKRGQTHWLCARAPQEDWHFHLSPRQPRDTAVDCAGGRQDISQRLHFSWDGNSKKGDSLDETSQFWLRNNVPRDKRQKSPRNIPATQQVLKYWQLLCLPMRPPDFCNVQRHPCWKVLEAFENKGMAPRGLSVWLQFPQKQAQVNIKGLASEGLDLLCVCLGTFPWFCIFGVNFLLRNWLQVQRGQVWGQEWVESPWNCRELDTHLTSPFFGPTC